LRAKATCALINEGDINAIKLGKSLGTPILVPLFPRPELKEIASNLQLQAITRASLEELPQRLARVDQQLIAVIDAAREKLAAKCQPVQSRVLIAGFSAGGAFANRFTVLHPERVLAAAVGSPGGWPIAPVAADQCETLRCPVGIADVKDLTGQAVDLEPLRRVRFLFFLGNADTNDSVPIRDSFSAVDRDLINRRFGKTPVARFRLYHVVCHEPTCHEVTPQMQKVICRTCDAQFGSAKHIDPLSPAPALSPIALTANNLQ
jgi:hypothetical protein